MASAAAPMPAERRPPGLIIFDCDGVLVDSEPIAMRVLLDEVARQGVSIGLDTGFRQFLGRSQPAVLENLRREYGLRLDEAALARMRDALYAAYARQLQPMAGLIDALSALRLPACVASSSPMDRIEMSLTLTGLWTRFAPAVFSAAMVPRGKPAPDLFLHAARNMGVSPDATIVIEDSPAGIVAAQRAGMRVFAFVGGAHIEPSGLRREIEALHPDALFDDMHALPGLVERQEKNSKAR